MYACIYVCTWVCMFVSTTNKTCEREHPYIFFSRSSKIPVNKYQVINHIYPQCLSVKIGQNDLSGNNQLVSPLYDPEIKDDRDFDLNKGGNEVDVIFLSLYNYIYKRSLNIEKNDHCSIGNVDKNDDENGTTATILLVIMVIM